MWFPIQLSEILPQYIDICQRKKSIYCVFFKKNNQVNIFLSLIRKVITIFMKYCGLYVIPG
jgi:hypothetical protein